MTEATDQASADHLKIGIQGEIGSFNEVAILSYLGRVGVQDYELDYLCTTERVLGAVLAGSVDMGQFAIHNSLGGTVNESAVAMAKYEQYGFTTIDQYSIKIAHGLMIRPDAQLSAVTTIMTHPQVLAQCKATLAEKYPGLEQATGEGDLIDPATVAKKLGRGELPRSIAVMGNTRLAEINGLVIVEGDLQDSPENFSTFRLVKRHGRG